MTSWPTLGLSKDKQLGIKWSDYIPHTPTPKQLAFLILPHLEAFYGGAAGPGKTEALLMAALQYVDIPGYSALILMRSYTDLSLPRASMNRAHEWLGGTLAQWNGITKTWTFPSGATLTFGYLEHEKDKYRYKTAEFQFIAFDELTSFTETQFLYLFSRLRKLEGVNIPLRMRAGSNPDGDGYEWVKRRYIEPGHPQRPFLPATLEDNPYINRDEYVKALMNLDPITRERLLRGDWTIKPEGRKFKRHWFKIIENNEIPARLHIVRYWDLASTEPKEGKDPDWTVGAKVGFSQDKIYYILDIQRIRATPLDVEKLIEQTAKIDGQGVQIWMEQEPGSSGVNTIDYYTRHILQGYYFKGLKTTGSKEIRANPLSSQAEAGNIKILSAHWNKELLDEIELFPQGTHDDQVDAVSGAFQILSGVNMEVPQVASRKRRESQDILKGYWS